MGIETISIDAKIDKSTDLEAPYGNWNPAWEVLWIGIDNLEAPYGNWN